MAMVMTLCDTIYSNFFMRVLDIFRFSTIRLQVNLAAFELSTETLSERYNLNVEILDINNDAQISTWCDIINNSYTEFNFNVVSARTFLKDESYYKKAVTYLFTDNCTGEYCAAISVGQYAKSPKVGGDFKIGVRKEFQGKGLGRLVILYGFSRLKERGLEVGESAIQIKRDTSLYLHFKLGFRPQYKPRYFALPVSSKLYSIIKFFPLLKLRRAYNKFIDKENRKFNT